MTFTGRRRVFVHAALVTVCAVTSSCSTTILDSINSTTTVAVATSTTVPSGSVVELLAAMQTATAGLGDLVAQKRNIEARERLQTVEAVWTALRPALVALGNDSDIDVERIVNLVRTAVNKKRPADADKASRFLTILVEAAG